MTNKYFTLVNNVHDIEHCTSIAEAMGSNLVQA